MNVRFRTNLGSMDARRLNAKYGAEIDHTECVVDAEVNVKDSAAKELVDRGIAELITVKGQAKKPEIAAVK